MDVVERTSSVLTQRDAELETLRKLSAEMRSALVGASAVDLSAIDSPDSPLSPADQHRFRLLASVEDRITPTAYGAATPTDPPTPLQRSTFPISRTLTFEEIAPPSRTRARATSSAGARLPPIRTRGLGRAP